MSNNARQVKFHMESDAILSGGRVMKHDHQPRRRGSMVVKEILFDKNLMMIYAIWGRRLLSDIGMFKLIHSFDSQTANAGQWSVVEGGVNVLSVSSYDCKPSVVCVYFIFIWVFFGHLPSVFTTDFPSWVHLQNLVWRFKCVFHRHIREITTPWGSPREICETRFMDEWEEVEPCTVPWKDGTSPKTSSSIATKVFQFDSDPIIADSNDEIHQLNRSEEPPGEQGSSQFIGYFYGGT